MTQAYAAGARGSWEEPASHARSGPEAGVLSAITDADCSIAVWQRPVDSVVHTRVKALAASEGLELRLNLTPAQLKHDLVASITAKCVAPSAMDVQVAILKGERYPGAAGRGQVHRSPPIAAAGTARVLFSLDI